MNHVDVTSGQLTGEGVSVSERRLGDLDGLYADAEAFAAMDPGQPGYRVQRHAAVEEGTPGGLFFGTSLLFPGRVGDEYFMTRGHVHARPEASEYYWCIRGEGALILMDEARTCRWEALTPGSLHYIPGYTAHRLANTGQDELVVGACWPSDAGHDYARIAEAGFSARLRCVDGMPRLVPG